MRNYLSEAFREEAQEQDRQEADQAIGILQENIEQLVDNLS